MLTFESSSVLGANAIVEKLSVRDNTLIRPRCAGPVLTWHCKKGLPFQTVKHQVATLDAQPTMVDGGIVILVTGQLLVRKTTPGLT